VGIKVRNPSDKPARAAIPGNITILKPGETRNVPNGVLAQLLEKGCELLSNEAGVASLKAGLAGISPDPAERRAQVDEAVKQVLRSGLPQDFTGQGAPRVSAVQPLLPFHVTREEVLQSFDDIAADDQSQRHS